MLKFDHVEDAVAEADEDYVRIETGRNDMDEGTCAIMGGNEDVDENYVVIYRPHCQNKVVLCESIILKAAEFINSKKGKRK